MAKALVLVGCCLVLAAADRNEAKGARRSARFQEADVAMSRLQVDSEVESNVTSSAMSALCQTQKAQVATFESQQLREVLLQRMAGEHGAEAATKLDRAMKGKNCDCKKGDGEGSLSDKEYVEKILKMSQQERTKMMMDMKTKELVWFWMPSDCNTIMESEQTEKKLKEFEKESGSGTPKDVPVEGTTDAELAEEKSLEDHCHKMFHFMALAAHQFKAVKAAISNDSDQKKKTTEKPTTDTSTDQQPATNTVDGKTTTPNTKSGGGLLQLSGTAEQASFFESWHEVLDHAMRVVLDTALPRHASADTQHTDGTMARVEIDAQGSAATEQRQRRSKQVAKHDA